MMALDPFFQQVVSFPDRWALEKELTSKIPKTVRYDPGVGIEYLNGVENMSNDPDLYHLTEKFAYSNGTQPVPYANGTRPDIPLVSLARLVQYHSATDALG